MSDRSLLGSWLVACAMTATSAWAAPPTKIDFNEQIRPLLSDRCFQCHGPDEKKREAELRLDRFEDATVSQAVVPGNPAASEILKRITSTDPAVMMPPPVAKKAKFSEPEIELLTRWIQQGAEYQGHWAFLPMRDNPPPAVMHSWIKNPIDQFVASRLVSEGLEPSPEADRATLIRRLSLDLLGLLPTPEEVVEFMEDPEPAAYERLVERLLSSPHYGERWGRHWLDQARYADSNGYSIDAPREMWPYRDWVIDALNRDLPFDQFTVEQLAGDLLPTPDKSQLVATGFHRNTLINQEGGTSPEQFRVEAAMDRVNTTGAVWLGLTVGCAQCHSHKFDPLTQREYYEFLAFFNSGQDVNNTGATTEVVRGEMFGRPVEVKREPPPPSAQQIAEWRQAWENATRTRIEEAMSAGVNSSTAWQPLLIDEVRSVEQAVFQRLDDQSVLATSPVAGFDAYHVQATSPLPQIAAVRLRVLTHDSLPKQGPGRAGNGNFVLTAFELTFDGQPVGWSKAVADVEQINYPIVGALDDDPKTGWAINTAAGASVKMNAPHEAVFVLGAPLKTAGKPISLTLRHDLNRDYLIGRFALDVIAETPALLQGSDGPVLAALQAPAEQRTEEQRTLLQQAFEQAEPRAKKKTPPPNPDLAQAMVMKELPKPRETFVLTRGDFTRPDEERGALNPGVFAAIAPMLVSDPSSRNRLDLARWLIDPEHPLTTRVTMNRIWMRYFGRGLVETEEDFGTQGSMPTHPELLDWLAREFQRQGWSQKRMHRLIVTSATYRQSSHARGDLAEKDPRNLWLGRQNRLRLDAEVIRDVALSASGRLHEILGGPSVYPPQTDGVYAFTQVKKNWPTETGPNRYRRTMYTFFYRSAPYPLFTTFDSPDFQSVCTRRIRSNTPLQALTLANDLVFFELAQGLAQRVITESSGDAATPRETRIERAFWITNGRAPTSAERAVLVEYLRRTTAEFAADASGAEALTTAELRALAPAAEAAALVLVARTLFNTDNFITRE
ncbi:MAG: PSD1 and planctomycete cytochrome C domain-containing protein [Planctomycetaceae bacterium]|nr:PSD1 and planctomycete cytochrome C domain-containing protein [Planctomycetaceae bacterium]